MNCVRVTMRSPLTARTTSPAFSPARSAGSPAITDATIGLMSGSTPMLPISKRVSETVRNETDCVWPSRSSVSATSRSGRVPTAMKRSSQVST